MVNWVSYQNLVADCIALARRLPRDTVGVLGVPRSGMLAASIIAQELDCHLGDVYSFMNTGCTFMRPGRRMNWQRDPSGPVIVVDDSLYAGAAMDQAKAALRANPMLDAYYDYQFAAVYLAPGMQDRVHWYQHEVALPRLFEWNWRHSDLLTEAMCDMDGVLCEDPECNDDDAERYVDFLWHAKPLHRPHRRLGWVVTGRLERFRGGTEDWLMRHGIEYERLFMAPFETAVERRAYKAAKWKADVYRTSEAKLFIESDVFMAASIAQDSGRRVLCPTNGKMF